MITGNTLALVSRRGSESDPTALDQLLSKVNARGGQSAVHDYSLANVMNGIWTSRDRSSNAREHTQATAAQHPLIGGQGASFDGVNDNVRQSIAAGSFSFVFSFAKGASTNGFIPTNQSGTERLHYQSANATAWAAGMTVDVDGVSAPTRNALNAALIGTVVVAASGVSFAGDTQIQIGRSGGSSPLGTIRWMIVLDHAALGSELGPARELARTVAASF